MVVFLNARRTVSCEIESTTFSATGRPASKFSVPSDATDEQVVEAAQADETIAAAIAGKQIKRAIVVKGRLVNLIV